MASDNDFRYPTPTASVYDDPLQYIPLLLTAVDAALDRRDVWLDEDADLAVGYMEDLKAWLMDFPTSMTVDSILTDDQGNVLTDDQGIILTL